MKIVILDGATAKGRELNFDFLNQFGEVTYYDVTYPDEVLSRAKRRRYFGYQQNRA